jgi:hypothetical protein
MERLSTVTNILDCNTTLILHGPQRAVLNTRNFFLVVGCRLKLGCVRLKTQKKQKKTKQNKTSEQGNAKKAKQRTHEQFDGIKQIE